MLRAWGLLASFHGLHMVQEDQAFMEMQTRLV